MWELKLVIKLAAIADDKMFGKGLYIKKRYTFALHIVTRIKGRAEYRKK